MTLPNKITLSRLVLTPIGLVFLFLNSVPYNILISTVIFAVAMFTDLADGYIARKYGQITNVGKFIDSLADKLIILLYMIFLQSVGIYPMWLVLAFVGREMVMDGWKSYAVSQKIFISARRSGKNKALLQTISLFLALIYLSIGADQFFGVSMRSEIVKEVAYYTMLAAFILSVYGAYSLLKRNPQVFSERKK
ncbi:MAG: CDP-diacylglycerol--glycerol-3-phosphate 3-phosphatidyltransferase [bacterium]|nr:CDP-diacylglycerol--glycerol-3-phosphate 3-phosphatidyltransferase [bacterium]